MCSHNGIDFFYGWLFTQNKGQPANVLKADHGEIWWENCTITFVMALGAHDSICFGLPLVFLSQVP